MSETEKDTKAQARKRYGVSEEDFVVAWQTSATADEAATKLNMPKDTAIARASYYRKKGVHLKNMPKKKSCLDAAKLNKLAGSGLNHEVESKTRTARTDEAATEPAE